MTYNNYVIVKLSMKAGKVLHVPAMHIVAIQELSTCKTIHVTESSREICTMLEACLL